jgi:5-methylcytosine-specific restriction endonuclease McrA
MWVKVDDRFPEHPKVVAASKPLGPYGEGRVIALWSVGMCYCNRNETDGYVMKKTIGGWTTFDRRPLEVAAAMAAPMPDGKSGLLEDHGDRYRFHDYEVYQLSAQEIKTKREWDARRKQLYAIPGLVDSVRQRDQGCCRYCRVRVNWKDRRSAQGGTYDHVEPRGPNTMENIVVACYRCNTKKGGRRPEEAGMVLLPPPDPPVGGGGSANGRDYDSVGSKQAGLETDLVSTRSELDISSQFQVGDQCVPDPDPDPGTDPEHKFTGRAARAGIRVPVENARVLKAVVWRESHAIYNNPNEEWSLPNLVELLKCKAAEVGLVYDGDAFRDQAELAFTRVPLQSRRSA